MTTIELLRDLKARKHCSNLRLQFLQALGEQRPITERYIDGELDVHLHVARRGIEIRTGVELRARVERGTDLPSDRALSDGIDEHEFTMLVLVRESAEKLRPVVSVVRLYRLDDLPVPVTDAGEPALPHARELVFVTFQWKLGERLEKSPRQLEDGIVEAGTEVVDHFPDPDAQIGLGAGALRELYDFLALVRLVVGKRELALSAPLGDQRFDIREVFLCPAVPKERTIQGLDHP